MKNVLVTGGAGFIGSNFVRFWLSAHPGHRVINLDALTYAGNLDNLQDLAGQSNCRLVQGDLCGGQLVRQIFANDANDTAIHFAAKSHAEHSILGPEAFVRTNVVGTITLLEAARKIWCTDLSCRFLRVSTEEVYGSLGPHDTAFTEKKPYASQ